ncbi:MAG: PIN domain-containing protein [Verrucomicrobia bacterium]|nr:PIN domain-containing protein [Verrucomicrobiota bacterium]
MEVILDTNALSAWLDGDEELKLKISSATTVWLSPIVLGEYRYGIKGSRHKNMYESELAELERDLPILLIDASTSESYAEIRCGLQKTGRTIPWHDVWIAAQAKQHGFQVVSWDKHFDNVSGVSRLAW